MYTRGLIFIFLTTLATSLPSLETSGIETIQGTLFNPSTNMSAMAPPGTKSWQAAGGCKAEWDRNSLCIWTCTGEANAGKCPGWYKLTGVLKECWKGATVWTCRCDCLYS
jgi:hypothetical protein